MNTQPNYLTIASLHQAYQEQNLSLRDYLTQQWQSAKQDQHNAWISLISESQLDGYIRQLEQANIDDLPLYGVPFAIKDNIDLADLPTTAGCEAFSYQPKDSAFVVQLLVAAGAVPIGKTNLDQFATGLVGTRSPWGAVKNSFNPDYVSGGSSSGSGVVVADHQVLFALGTDTAGSGRVPAAFNNIYGLKASKGLLSCQGVVPACRSLDCVTLFSKSASDLSLLFDIVAQYDEKDAYSRRYQPTLASNKKCFNGLKVGVPFASQWQFFANAEYQAAFEQSLVQLKEMGAELVEFDLAPFISAAELLYQGPWVAERYAAIEGFFQADRTRCLPVINTILSGAEQYSAVDTFKSIYQLQAYKVQCDALLNEVDVVVTPTAGTIHTIEAVNADPITLNSQLGYYTNFMNLLDYAAIAIPTSITASGLPFGVTLFSPAFSDHMLLSLAQQWQRQNQLPLGATSYYAQPWELEAVQPVYQGAQVAREWMDILVCGAHMQGLPLNHQLISLGGSLKQSTHTSAHYQLFALAGGPPLRPGLVRSDKQGQKIAVEIWRLPKSCIGELLSQIPAPLGLGNVQLESGDWVKGFICEPIGLHGAQDISHLGGWRAYLAQEETASNCV